MLRQTFTPKNINWMGRGIPQGLDNKISRPLESFMIARTQLTFKKLPIFEAPNKYFTSGKVKHTYAHT